MAEVLIEFVNELEDSGVVYEARNPPRCGEPAPDRSRAGEAKGVAELGHS